jgi:cytochrome P450
MKPELDLKHPANLQDPYPLYRWLREEDPVHWSESLRGWAVSRYDDCLDILQHPLRFSADRFRKLGAEFRSSRPAVQDVARVLQDWLVFRDPPDHTRMRRLLHNTFTPRELDAMRPRIQRVVEDLLDGMAGQEKTDFVSEFAFPLPASVIAIMLGAPVEDIDALKRWSDQIAAFIGGHQAETDNVEEARQGAFHLMDYFRDLIAERKGHPRDDLISLMLAAEEDGDALTPEEVVSNCVLLLAAGHETTTNLLGSGLYLLLRHPDQLRLLRHDPELAPGAVEELLRMESPVPAVVKVATEPVELHGREIRPGEMIFPLLGSANRDERRFEQPDALNIARHPNRHLAFGHGIHFCLGGPLARVEAQIAFAALLRRFESIALAGPEPRWMPKIFLRGLESLPVTLRPAARALGS